MSRLSLARLLPIVTGMMAVVLIARIYAVVLTLDSGDKPSDVGSLVTSAAAAAPATTPAAVQPPAQASAPAPAAPPPANVGSQEGAEMPAPAAAMPSANACDHDPACQGKPVASTPGKDEATLVADVATRQHQLDTEAATLDNQKRAVEAAEAALSRRIASIATSEAALRQSEQHDTALSEDDAQRLVKIYQAMKPADAAAIFDILDLRVCTHLLGLMDARHASAIMGVMLPQRAILATQMLAKSHPLPPGMAERAG